MRDVKGDPAVVRQLNRNLLLNLLRREGQLSRVHLKKRSGLSASAVTAVVAELLQEGLVRENEAGASTGGRRPILLTLDYGARCAVGIKLMQQGLAAVLTDIRTEVLDRQDAALPSQDPGEVVRITAEAVHELLKRNHLARNRLMGVGVGLPGVVDSATGRCLHTSFLGWENVPLGPMLEAALGCPVHIDNDVNAFAAAERLFGHGRAARNMAVVTLGLGVGCGLVLDGRVYRGRDGGAGEIGHMTVEVGGRQCTCGRRGCLEAYTSGPALLAQLRERDPTTPDNLTLTGFSARLQAGDPAAKQVAADAARHLGVALAGVVNLLNPELLVIGGENVCLGDPFFGPVRETLIAHCFATLGDQLEIIVEPWGDDQWARGAASLAVSRTFEWR